jgi:hypothetical protein
MNPDEYGAVRVFRQKFTLEGAIGSHVCSLQVSMFVNQWHSSRWFTPLTGWHCKLRPKTEGQNYSAIHPALVLSKEVVIVGSHKLIVAQNFGWPTMNDWRQKDGSWIKATNATTPPCG